MYQLKNIIRTGSNDIRATFYENILNSTNKIVDCYNIEIVKKWFQ